MRRLGWIRALAGLALAAAFSAGAFVPQAIWDFTSFDTFGELPPAQNPTTLAIRYRLGAEAWSATNRTAELDAVRAAFAQWQAVAGTQIKFEELPAVSGVTDVDLADSICGVAWFAGGRSYGGYLFAPNATAVTIIQTSDIGFLVEADILLNRDLQWFTGFDPGLTQGHFVEAVAAHEIGHLLGLHHSPLGGATMFWLTQPGLGSAAGLSADEVAAAKALYGSPATKAALGTIKGTVSLNGAGVLGANITVENAAGTVVSGTVSGADGAYSVPALSPGNHTLRVTPLDPNLGGSDAYLVRGGDLDVYNGSYNNAATGFLPGANLPVTVTAGGTVTKNIAVAAGNPPFRIVETRRFFTEDGRTSGDLCMQLTPGQTNAWVGVYTQAFPGADATLRLTGGGLTYGSTVVVSNALRRLWLVQVPVSVAMDAAPGLRSVAVTAGGFTAWANGFAEVLPRTYDLNFDGLDDLFQRRWFSPFTKPEAGPEQDPDGDGFVNRREAAMGSSPTDKLSVNYRVISVKLAANGTTVTWESAPGRGYQVFSRADLAGAVWQPVGLPVKATGETAQLLDGRPADTLRFYQVRDAP